MYRFRNHPCYTLAVLVRFTVYLCCMLTVSVRYSYLYFQRFRVAMPELPELSEAQLLSIEMQGYHKAVWFAGFSAITAIGWMLSRKSVESSLKRTVDVLSGLLSAYFLTDLLYSGAPNWFDHISTSLAIVTWFYLIIRNNVLRNSK